MSARTLPGFRPALSFTLLYLSLVVLLPLGALVTEHSQQEEQQQERVFLSNPVDRDRVDVERPDQRRERRDGRAEEHVRHAEHRDGRGRAGDGVRQADRRFDRLRQIIAAELAELILPCPTES